MAKFSVIFYKLMSCVHISLSYCNGAKFGRYWRSFQETVNTQPLLLIFFPAAQCFAQKLEYTENYVINFLYATFLTNQIPRHFTFILIFFKMYSSGHITPHFSYFDPTLSINLTHVFCITKMQYFIRNKCRCENYADIAETTIQT